VELKTPRFCYYKIVIIIIIINSHWKELMEKTGQTFEMNVESFTLQSIFAMELHRFQDKIAEIVNCAIKELAIEKVITGRCNVL